MTKMRATLIKAALATTATLTLVGGASLAVAAGIDFSGGGSYSGVNLFTPKADGTGAEEEPFATSTEPYMAGLDKAKCDAVLGAKLEENVREAYKAATPAPQNRDEAEPYLKFFNSENIDRKVVETALAKANNNYDTAYESVIKTYETECNSTDPVKDPYEWISLYRAQRIYDALPQDGRSFLPMYFAMDARNDDKEKSRVEDLEIIGFYSNRDLKKNSGGDSFGFHSPATNGDRANTADVYPQFNAKSAANIYFKDKSGKIKYRPKTNRFCYVIGGTINICSGNGTTMKGSWNKVKTTYNGQADPKQNVNLINYTYDPSTTVEDKSSLEVTAEEVKLAAEDLTDLDALKAKIIENVTAATGLDGAEVKDKLKVSGLNGVGVEVKNSKDSLRLVDLEGYKEGGKFKFTVTNTVANYMNPSNFFDYSLSKEIVVDIAAPKTDKATIEDALETSKVVSGKGIPSAHLTIIVKSKDGTQIYTNTTVVKDDGTWEIPLAQPLEEGQSVTVTQLIPGHSPSEEVTVPVTPAPKLADPTVEKVYDGDQVLTGSGTAGAAITVTVNGKEYTTTVDESGKWKVDLDTPLTETDEVSVQQSQDRHKPSNPVKVPVIGLSKVPTLDPAYEGDQVLTGSGTAGAAITVTVNGKEYTTTVDESGKWKVDLDTPLVEGDKFTVTQTEKDRKPTQAEGTVKGISASPTVDPAYEGDQVLTGSGTAGAAITVTVNGKEYTTTVDESGKWKVDLDTPLVEGDKFTVTQTEKDRKPTQAEGTVMKRPAVPVVPDTAKPLDKVTPQKVAVGQTLSNTGASLGYLLVSVLLTLVGAGAVSARKLRK